MSNYKESMFKAASERFLTPEERGDWLAWFDHYLYGMLVIDQDVRGRWVWYIQGRFSPVEDEWLDIVEETQAIRTFRTKESCRKRAHFVLFKRPGQFKAACLYADEMIKRQRQYQRSMAKAEPA